MTEWLAHGVNREGRRNRIGSVKPIVCHKPPDRAAACGDLKLFTSCLPLLWWYLNRLSIAESDLNGAVFSDFGLWNASRRLGRNGTPRLGWHRLSGNSRTKDGKQSKINAFHEHHP